MLLKDLVKTLDKESFCDLIISHKGKVIKFNSNKKMVLGKLSELTVKSISFETCNYDSWINLIIECN
jgi:hypothetical protein